MSCLRDNSTYVDDGGGSGCYTNISTVLCRRSRYEGCIYKFPDVLCLTSSSFNTDIMQQYDVLTYVPCRHLCSSSTASHACPGASCASTFCLCCADCDRRRCWTTLWCRGMSCCSWQPWCEHLRALQVRSRCYLLNTLSRRKGMCRRTTCAQRSIC